jgi:hypothetical protein
MHDSEAPAEVPREADLKPASNVEAGDEIGGQSSLRKPGTQRSLGMIGLCISAASLGLYQHKSGYAAASNACCAYFANFHTNLDPA